MFIKVNGRMRYLWRAVDQDGNVLDILVNNRAENSHVPTRERERGMKGFRSVATAQRFLAAFSRISPHFRPRRHLMTAPDYRTEMIERFTIWHQITGTTLIATGA